MNKEDFDEYWEKNSADYIEHAKSIAFQDFTILTKKKLGQFVACIEIDSDDDFSFKIDSNNQLYYQKDFFSFEIYGNSKKDILKNSIQFIRDLKTIGCESKWQWLRDATIQKLNEGETCFSFGGNQTIDFYIKENIPQLKFKK